MNVIDFTNCIELINDFGGSEKKKKIIYNNEIFMIKFPDPIREENNDLSYVNNTFSEYIGCHIYNSCKIPAQKTYLGIYYDKSSKKEKVVVACRSFENDNLKLVEFSKFLLSSNFDSKSNDKLELNEILNIMKTDERLNKTNSLEMFYKTLIIDTLIGNEDRHQDNFGFTYNNNSNNIVLQYSPIYDCGSCLSPLVSDNVMEKYLNNEVDFKNKEYNLYFKYCNNGKRINMHEFFNQILTDNNLISSLKEVYNNINIDIINNIIDNTNYISDIRKEYIKKSIKIRYDLIITPAYNKIKSNNLEYEVDEIKTDSLIKDKNNTINNNNGIEKTENDGRK